MANLTMTTELDRMIRTLRDAQDARRRLDLVGLGDKGTILDATRAFKENLALRPFITDQDRIRAKARLVVGPFEELRLAGVFEHASQFSRELKRIAPPLTMRSFVCRISRKKSDS